GAGIAMNYAMLGAFSIAISRSGVTELIAQKLFACIGRQVTQKQIFCFKYSLIAILTLIAISSQNLIPVHIAFIPVLIPPLLPVFERIRLDRRMVACILTFGLITPYMVLPVGFGKIYINEVVLGSIRKSGMDVLNSQAPGAMLIPAAGMLTGLLIAIFFSYRKPRDYSKTTTDRELREVEPKKISLFNVGVGVVAIAVALAGQFLMDSLIVASVLAVLVFVCAGVIRIRDTQDVFTQGVYLMGGIGLVMIAASGFAEVMRATGGVDEMVKVVGGFAGDYKGVAVFLMLFIGLVITMGIGSSFSTVPLIAAIYVPLCMSMGLSAAATIAIVGSAGALGDAGSPVSESVLGPTAGLNADGQHDHIYDSVIPTFLHYNLPLLAAGWVAGMVL
ncbi:Na+/H+ antiporter family protein, partial [Victivallis vadensis]|uniref:Na+/H+ antiporter family protein n=1 Tax=Victivallis vadensis TaxID=172901 RepID=UPI003AF509C0